MSMPTEKEFLKALEDKHGKSAQEKFRAASVAVCGLGGLGSNIAVALTRAGVGRLHLIDFDRVEITNLNRQQYKISQIGEYKAEALKKNLSEISPFTEYVSEIVKITEDNIPELFTSDGVICEAFDGAENKAMLVSGALANYPDKFVVAGSGLAGFGSPNRIITRKITERFYISGDGTDGVEECKTLCGARVQICAAHQALTILRLISGITDL